MAVTATYKLKVVQIYSQTSTKEDEAVNIFHEDVVWALNKLNIQNTIVIGDSDSKQLRQHILYMWACMSISFHWVLQAFYVGWCVNVFANRNWWTGFEPLTTAVIVTALFLWMGDSSDVIAKVKALNLPRTSRDSWWHWIVIGRYSWVGTLELPQGMSWRRNRNGN